MKRKYKKIVTLLSAVFVASIGFAQIEVNSVGNVGINATPSPNADGAKLTMESATRYSMYLTNTGITVPVPPYNSGYTYGIYTKNTNPAGGYGNIVYGIYSDNAVISGGSGSSVYGLYTNNSSVMTTGNTYGVYSKVSGRSALYSGYFTGGKVVMMGGAVGIGKNPTAGLLDVAGNIYMNGTLVSVSDERLKNNIKDITSETGKLYKLQGKSYIKSLAPTFEMVNDTMREVKDTTTFFEYGYLAQELKEVFPELVSQDSEGYYGVNYVALIPVIIEALKDQQQTIAELKKELASKETNNLLKSAKIETIQNMYLSDNANVEDLKLYQNAPNPFNERTTVKCFVPEQFQKVQLCVYNMQGVQVQCLTITERGAVSIEIEAGALSAGIYSYVLLADGVASETKQMILTK